MVEPLELSSQYFAVEEDQCAERLVLCRGGHVAVHCQVRQKFHDLQRPHLVRVSHMVEEDEPPNPAHVGGLGSKAVVAQSDGGSDAIE